MRFPTALGGFLLVSGLVVLVLKPLYNAGSPIQPQGVEASVPLTDYRPIPTWVGAVGLAGGAALLAVSFMGHRRQ